MPGRRSHLAHGTGHDNRSTDKLGGRAACWHVPGVRALQSRSSASRDVATVQRVRHAEFSDRRLVDVYDAECPWPLRSRAHLRQRHGTVP